MLSLIDPDLSESTDSRNEADINNSLRDFLETGTSRLPDSERYVVIQVIRGDRELKGVLETGSEGILSFFEEFRAYLKGEP